MSLDLPSGQAPIADKPGGPPSLAYQGWFQKLNNALILTGPIQAGQIIVSGGGNTVVSGGPVTVISDADLLAWLGL